MIKIKQGRWIDEDSQVKQLFANHYKKQQFALHDTRNMWERSKLTYPQLENDIMSKLGEDVTDD